MYLQLTIQAHSRAVENARSVSTITVNFFKTLDMHASNLTQIVEETQTVNDQKLSEFEKKFEVVMMLDLKCVDLHRSLLLLKLKCYHIYACRNVLPMKKGNCWKKLQSCLPVQMLGRNSW